MSDLKRRIKALEQRARGGGVVLVAISPASGLLTVGDVGVAESELNVRYPGTILVIGIDPDGPR